MVKVFFNNSCNICRAEINHYKKHNYGNLEWIDVTNNQEAQKITSKSYKELLRRMHVMQDGKLIEGAEVFLIIWKNIPKYNFLYKLFKIKPLFFLLNIFYEIAAYFLFIKNKHLLKNEKK
ncbi:MAG: thiol-disulfide oxidoreductase DCC family protein [Pelagibacteraceae bacterium]